MLKELHHSIENSKFIASNEDKVFLEKTIDRYLKRWDTPCGNQIYYAGPGVDSEGWRTDVSLFEVDPSWATVGVWGDEIALSEKMADLGFSDDIEMTIKGWHVPRGGECVLKIGATTGLTGGIANGIRVTVYVTGHLLPDIETARNVEATRMLAIHPTADGGGFAASGDSGSAVLGQTEDHGGLDFVGLLVSLLVDDSVLGHGLGLMTPAQKVFEHLKTGTGIEWTVRGG